MTRAHGGAAIVDEVLDDLRKPFDSVGRSTEGGIDSRDARRDDHSTIYRRVQHFVPEFGRNDCADSGTVRSRDCWGIDETCVKGRGKLKLLIRSVHGFKTLKTASATIKGLEVTRTRYIS